MSRRGKLKVHKQALAHDTRARDAATPAWLPVPVRNRVALLEKLFSGLESDLEILRRLATDRRMYYVWRELTLREATGEALVEFFHCAFQRARLPYFVTTPKDRAALAAAWTRTAKACRLSSYIERWQPELSSALDRAAEYFEETARREGRLDSPLVVKRHSDDGPGRAYVLVLGALTRKVFGHSLYRTVATTASVALQQDIDWQQVREWLKR